MQVLVSQNGSFYPVAVARNNVPRICEQMQIHCGLNSTHLLYDLFPVFERSCVAPVIDLFCSIGLEGSIFMYCCSAVVASYPEYSVPWVQLA